MPRRADSTVFLLAGALLLAAVALGWVLFRGSARLSDSGPSGESGGAEPTEADQDRLVKQVETFCGDCHAVPDPGYFPKNAWYDEVRRGFDFYQNSGRTDLRPPPLEQIVQFYRGQAPETLVLVGVPERDAAGKRFSLQEIGNGKSAESAVSHVRWAQLADDSPGVLIVCDMRSGEIRAVSPKGGESRLLANAGHPAHAEPCDLDGDGLMDLVAADLGSFLPEDHQRGRVLWLRQTQSGDFEQIILKEGLGRVADVQPADFDGDGDLDLIVAEFGWLDTGSVLLLRNTGRLPDVELATTDERHGAIHVPVADLNGDGRPDFVALFAQEYETIDGFLNLGDGTFERVTVGEPRDPAYGSSGIQLVDLDGDGDLDVLYTNGDTFDGFYVKPYHSIQWLENRGGYPFTAHHLAFMPGVHRALAADLDGDGDLDIAAVALLPDRLFGSRSAREATFDSILWLEQTAPGEFRRHSIEQNACYHAALEIEDADGDGTPGLAVGGFTSGSKGRVPSLGIWRNPARSGIQRDRSNRETLVPQARGR